MIESIIKIATIISSLTVILGVIIAIYKIVERDKKQSKIIGELQDEQLIICKGVRGALEGLIEQGCDGPCKEALSLLDDHLNKRAHKTDI